MKPLLLFALLFSLGAASCTSRDEYRRKKLKYFKEKFQELEESKPSDLALMFLEHCEDKSSPFSKYSPAMINSQIAYFYEAGAEHHAKLIVEILKYKKIEVQETSVFKMETFVKTLTLNKKDPFDYLILRSYELMVSYAIEKINLESEFSSRF